MALFSSDAMTQAETVARDSLFSPASWFRALTVHHCPSPAWDPCPSYHKLTCASQCVPLPGYPSSVKRCLHQYVFSCSLEAVAEYSFPESFFVSCPFLHCPFLIKTVVWSSHLTIRWRRGCGQYEESEVLTVSQFCLLVFFLFLLLLDNFVSFFREIRRKCWFFAITFKPSFPDCPEEDRERGPCCNWEGPSVWWMQKQGTLPSGGQIILSPTPLFPHEAGIQSFTSVVFIKKKFIRYNNHVSSVCF